MTDNEQEIAKCLREAIKSTPSPETLQRLEAMVSKLIAPKVSASLAPDGRVTVRIGRPRHDCGLAFVIQPAEVRILID